MVLDPKSLIKIDPKPISNLPSSEHVISGIPIPKTARVGLFSDSEWEDFTQEWLTTLEYYSVGRFAGGGDMGLDVVGFATEKEFEGEWDNYQCKHFDEPIAPSKVWIEFAKIIYFSFRKEYSSGAFATPRKYYFVAPKGIGTKLSKYLANSTRLKDEVRANWVSEIGIHKTRLEGPLLDWFESFDFSIFSSVSLPDMIEGHSRTTFHAVRFGGGLNPREQPPAPPEVPTVLESRYIQHLFRAYSEKLESDVDGIAKLEQASQPQLLTHFNRQRELFYWAESLRNFARDNVSEGTFQMLQDEIFSSVVDTVEAGHANGFERLGATLRQAASTAISSNPLKSAVVVQDRQGICHQLANDDRIHWVRKEDAK